MFGIHYQKECVHASTAYCYYYVQEYNNQETGVHIK